VRLGCSAVPCACLAWVWGAAAQLTLHACSPSRRGVAAGLGSVDDGLGCLGCLCPVLKACVRPAILLVLLVTEASLGPAAGPCGSALMTSGSNQGVLECRKAQCLQERVSGVCCCTLRPHRASCGHKRCQPRSGCADVPEWARLATLHCYACACLVRRMICTTCGRLPVHGCCAAGAVRTLQRLGIPPGPQAICWLGCVAATPDASA